jgi:hypothetical protein
MHTYYGPSPDVNFSGTSTLGWDWTGDPLYNSGEAAAFYIPLIADPTTSGSFYAGLQRVWRTTDSGGSQSYLDSICNEYTGTFTGTCGDWVPLGTTQLTASGTTFGTDKSGGYLAAIARATSDSSTLWTATRYGRLFISTNANASDNTSVAFTRLDTASQPNRFISGIAVDPKNPYHAYVSYSGYSANTPTTTGHVFSVVYDPTTGTATWTDLSSNLSDQPVTNIAYDGVTGDLYISTDFGVYVERAGSTTWQNAAPGMPMAAISSLTLSANGRVLYAATHGRGVYKLYLQGYHGGQ